MAEPFSTVAAAIALVATVVKVSKSTTTLICGIRGAPRSVSAILGNINSLNQVLETLNTSLQKVDIRRDPAQARIASILQHPLNNCKDTLEEIERELKPFVKPLSIGILSKWKSFKFTFREKDILALQRILQSSQLSLDTAVAVVHLESSAYEFKAIRRMMGGNFRNDSSSLADSSFMGSDAVSSDRGHTLKKYLLEPEVTYGNDSNVDFQVRSQKGSSIVPKASAESLGSNGLVNSQTSQTNVPSSSPRFDLGTAASDLHFGPSSDVWHRLEFWHLLEPDSVEASRRIKILMRLLMLVSKRMKAQPLNIICSKDVTEMSQKNLEEENDLVEMLETELQLSNLRQTVEGRFHGNSTCTHRLTRTKLDKNMLMLSQ